MMSAYRLNLLHICECMKENTRNKNKKKIKFQKTVCERISVLQFIRTVWLTSRKHNLNVSCSVPSWHTTCSDRIILSVNVATIDFSGYSDIFITAPSAVNCGSSSPIALRYDITPVLIHRTTINYQLVASMPAFEHTLNTCIFIFILTPFLAITTAR